MRLNQSQSKPRASIRIDKFRGLEVRYFVFLIVILSQLTSYAATITVDPNGFYDFTNIQAAIDASWDGDTIIVRPGTYNQGIKFNGRAVTLTSTDPNSYSIIISTIITNPAGTAVFFDFGEGKNSILTGFTITGIGTGAGNVYGHGIVVNGTSPQIIKNIIKECSFNGIYGSNGATPTISDNRIVRNGTSTGNATDSSGIRNCNGLISNNIISGNLNRRGSSSCGGGVAYCNGTIVNNIISGNRLVAHYAFYDTAGGAGLAQCNGLIANNTIIGNDATEATLGGGGGIFQCYGTIKNNIIAFNKAVTGGGILNKNTGCVNSYNCLWLNSNSNLAGNIVPGIGDIIRDPYFVTDGAFNGNIWTDGDYHLKSTAGRWTGTTWVIDVADSSCIDRGDPADAVGIEPNPNGGRIEIGAYGGTLQASKSVSGIASTICTSRPKADLDGDCKVNFKDFAELAGQWLDCNLEPAEACQ